MQDRVHQDSANASALATSMQVAAHPYHMQSEKSDNRKGTVQRNRVSANEFSAMRLWQQGRGTQIGKWKDHPSYTLLCCNGRVTSMATNVEVMTLGLWPRAQTIVSRNAWATQMCVHLINWFLEAEDPLDVQLEDERLRIEKYHWSNESKELVRPEPVRRPPEEENIPIKRAQTEVYIKKDDKKEIIQKEVQLQLQKEQKPPREDDRIVTARE